MEDKHNRKVGLFGEKMACKYLRKMNYKILDTNFYTYKGEIDIVSKFKNEYVFVEVKTRLSKQYGSAIEAVNKLKLHHFIDASKYYIYKNHLQNEKIRFDIIEVYINSNKITINHIKNILF